ncbi:hypothetical protein [Psychrobacter sp. MES7-P7E]|uniref:hypothetical protein n=1 Tax=Psychrobacter sp. MES7-P7E TaxID=2058322 RepID=UPI000C7F576D|nr:hypothetical protein [Psychrobacter sp. MES7-P7E]PLT21278.1 hypothetical protein CXF62_10915 [Psychrobacter sp. MES7-P7E]
MAKVLQRLDILLFANTAQYRSEMRDTQQSTTTMMGAIKADAANMAKVGAAAFAGMAAAGTAAIGVMIKEQTELANEIVKLAKVSNTNIDVMQKHIVAARAMGVEQETLGDIYKDTQDKIGDFLTTGGGAMADFFESMPPSVDMTAESFRNLSGPDALQRYYNGLQEANLSNSELIFYMESIASDASLLIPLLHDNGAGFDVWAEAAENAGVIMDEKTVAATQDLIAANSLLTLSVEGAKTQFTSAFIPVLADVADELVGTAGASDLAREMGEDLVVVFKSVAKVGIGVAAVFDVVGSSIGGVAATVGGLLNGVSMMDSVWVTSLKIAQNFGSANEIARLADQDISASLAGYAKQLEFIDNLGSGKRESRFLTAAKQQEELRRQLGLTGQAVQANAQAEADAAKTAEANAKKQASAAAAASKAAALIPKAVSDAILDGAKKLGINPNDLASVISFETGGTFSTNARNPISSATGLIQFMEGSDGKDDGKYFGMTRNQFGNLLPLQQMEHVVSYLKGRGIKPGADVAEVYDAVAGYGYKRGSAGYESNKVWDVNKDGVVAKGEAVTGKRFKAHIKDYYGDGVAIAQQSISQIMQSEVTAAAEQARIAEQQDKERIAIRLEYADEVTRIEEQLKTAILKIDASGFNDDERAAFIDDAIDVANAKLAQMQLTHDREMQYAQQSEQTDAERIRNQYALERREIQLTVNMDEQLRKAKIDALNQAEQLALDERRYAYDRELRDLTSIGQSDLAALRQSYADQRRVLDARTDIDDGQKSGLRNAMAGAQIYDTNQLQKGPRDAFESQQAQLGGYSQQYGLDQQLKQQLEVIENAKRAELLTVETYEQAKFATQQQYQQQTQQMMLGGAQEQFGSVTELMRMAFGEQNALYQAAFIGQKAMSIAQAVIAIPESYSKAFNAVVGIPFVGPALAPAAGIAAAALQVAQKAMIEQVQPPSMPGFEVGGYTGAGGTSDVAGLVHKEEFVANAPTTKRFRPELEAMHDGSYDKKYRNQGVNINITNNAPVDITTSVNDDGSIEMRIDKRINERVPQMMAQQINTPASPVRNALTNNFNLERRF